uniref:Uncharacterized protein n=1 Tax=Vitis vinifera TaxID=29760 RepID=A5BWR6_VITVI|nr:hypothetical protein VITISV_027336 [Vitis vinifera]
MVPAMELAGDSARELETALEFEPLSTLGFFCNGRPPDLVRYRLAGSFGGTGFTGGGFGLDGEGSGAKPGLGSFRRLFLRFEGDEDLAPRVRTISGYRNLADVADRRR